MVMMFLRGKDTTKKGVCQEFCEIFSMLDIRKLKIEIC